MMSCGREDLRLCPALLRSGLSPLMIVAKVTPSAVILSPLPFDPPRRTVSASRNFGPEHSG
jgi:hypothetical protein